MTPEIFSTLSDHEQEIMIFNEGNFIDSVLEDDYIFALYSVESFYVELEYDMTNYCISNKKVFESHRRFKKYRL